MATAFNTTRSVTTLVRSLLNDGGPNGAPVNIATISRTANVVTVVTAAAHGLVVGDQVVIAGVTGGATSFNNAAGTSFTVVSATPASNTFTYAQTGGNESGNPNTGTASGVGTGALFTDPVLLPYLNSAYRKVQRALANIGQETFVVDDVLIVVPAVSAVDPSVQVVVNDSTAPPNQLPTDLLVPEKLWERRSGSSDNFQEMVDLSDHGGLPSQPQGSQLLFWEWRTDGLYFLGATQDNQVRIRYQKALPDLTDGSTTILIRNAQDAMAYFTAAMAGMARGSPLAKDWDAAAIDALEDLIIRATQREQNTVRRRRPYGRRGGMGTGSII